MKHGRLYYVMGPSGAGKDSVLGWIREHGDPRKVLCAHRYITRPAHAGGENHVALSEAEFQSRLALGVFALTWHAHGLHYGIGREVEQWLQRGTDVLVNGSRNAYVQASESFSTLQPVLITASRDAIAKRLATRGRETEAEIAARLAHQPDYDVPSNTVVIHNDGGICDAGAALLQVLRRD